MTLFLPSDPGLDFWQNHSLVAQMVKNLHAVQDTGFDPWVRKIPWRREWQPTPLFLPGEFHGQRSPEGYSPWGRKESDTTELLTLPLLPTKGLPCDSDGKASAYNAGDPGSIRGLGRSSGEGNGNPLQYSCLENPMGGGACWATVHGVTKSQTHLSDFTS